VETTEIFPTVLDFMKVQKPPKIHGTSLLPLMAGKVPSIRDYAYMGHFKRNWAVTDGKWKFILNFDKGKANELYDLQGDLKEKTNLLEEKPQKATELELELRRFVAGLR
jgi:arylsulfatase A-like enzyme